MSRKGSKSYKSQDEETNPIEVEEVSDYNAFVVGAMIHKLSFSLAGRTIAKIANYEELSSAISKALREAYNTGKSSR